ncbi:MAG: SBBP repeat-containing protein, partial [Planctomycetota bacterium]
ITYAFSGSECINADAGRWVVKQEFIDAQPHVIPKAPDEEKPLDLKLNYFKGPREEWRTAVPAYSRIVYENIWPGIDLVFYGAANQLKYDLIVKPGAEPERIRFVFYGAEEVRLNKEGRLQIVTPACTLEDGAPRAFQVMENRHEEVPVRFDVKKRTGGSAYGVSFTLGPYDPAKTLIIDPAMMIYCGFVGGEGIEKSYGIAVDAEGCAYISGYTKSDALTFPLIAGPDLTYNGQEDAFVAKVNAEGTQFEYIGYIGGDEEDAAFRLAIDNEGNAYVTGITRSHESSFPVKAGPDLTFNGIRDAFVAKVNADGTDLVYCGYIGGADDESAYSLAVDSNDNAYITGWTLSDASTFPVQAGPGLTRMGDTDAFVTKISAQGTSLIYCGYIGGTGSDLGMGITVDQDGRAFIIGNTDSDESSFPVLGGPDLSHNGNTDAFAAKLAPSGQSLEYCGYIGGVRNENGMDIAVDSSGNAFVTGWTYSDENSFPIVTGPGLAFRGGCDAFVAKIDASGSGLIYSGFIGGSEEDFGLGIKINDAGCAFIGGGTYSDETSFPVKLGPDLTYNGDGWDVGDVFVANVDPQGSALNYCGYIGGDDNDGCYGLALGPEGYIYVTGWTLSTENTFPVTAGPDLTYNGGTIWAGDGFVAKVSPPTLTADATHLSQAGGVVRFTLDAGKAKANRNYLMLGSVTGFDPGFLLPGGFERIPIEWDAFTDAVLRLTNTSLFSDFLGTLDGSGQGAASLDWPGPSLPPGSVGMTLYFAYCLGWPWEFVSNPVEIEVVP